MEPYIPISMLNDFIFCPRSIYFHQVHGGMEQDMYHTEVQIEGKAAHQSIEKKYYSTQKDVLIGIDVYSEKYNVAGKIDIFDVKACKLVERKNKVVTIYDGYVFQVYAQTFALREMGYEVKKIVIHDKTHNKNYPIPLPEDDDAMLNKFEKLIDDVNSFDLHDTGFNANIEKCKRCIYSHLCDYCLC
ncbi:MAG TPA: type V CRISPR-associated protein Cas4 [Spirochaetota bacterium]|nr:type V CRISPR-associated protein Cas4 [Spirochaetota bacterium]HOF13562.1 type V CRISPR-associated protein Cas4 [Spirochaetota bacterium]HOM88091.1 type V CRISPR-associated protein Cas4 [Spirochaetota bacterium]HOR94333.1 type V CRISPR-associated protein Cas4 [Spirochaetota bacterium]HOT20052.1 type V CRISPR-associated protein Cas4 [Spirochaetota bacterium]